MSPQWSRPWPGWPCARKLRRFRGWLGPSVPDSCGKQSKTKDETKESGTLSMMKYGFTLRTSWAICSSSTWTSDNVARPSGYFSPVESVSVLVAADFDELAFAERQFLVASVGIGRHGRRIVVEQGDKDARLLLHWRLPAVTACHGPPAARLIVVAVILLLLIPGRRLVVVISSLSVPAAHLRIPVGWQ